MADDKDTKTNSTQTQNTASTMTPNVPSWLAQPIQSTIGSLTSLSPSALTPETANPLQTTASTNASNLSGMGTGALTAAITAALGMTNPAAPTYAAAQTSPTPAISTATYAPATTNQVGYKPVSMTGATVAPVGNVSGTQISTADIQRLMNPEINDVVNTTLAGFDRQAGQDQASLDANAGLNSGAFGSSGYALDKSNLTGLNALNRASTEAGLRSQAYDTALTGATTDAANTQQANLSNQSTQLARAIQQATLDQSTASTNQAATNAGKEFTATAGNTGLLANQAATDAASSQNATAQNSTNQLLASLQQALGISNTGAVNTASQSNQGAQLSTLAQQLQNILGLGNLGTQQNSDAVNDVAAQAGLGQQLYGQDLASQQYPMTYLQQVLSALGATANLFTGQSTTGTGTATGTGDSNTTGFGITGVGVGPKGFSITGG